MGELGIDGKMLLKQILQKCQAVDWIHLAPHRIQWQAFDESAGDKPETAVKTKQSLRCIIKIKYIILTWILEVKYSAAPENQFILAVFISGFIG